MKNIVYFDLETRRSHTEVGGWHQTAKMGMSVGVTYSTATQKYRIFTEEEAGELIAQLQQADLVVGYNHVGFDYGVLQAFTMWDIKDSTRNLDMCLDIGERVGKRIPLDSVATCSIGNTKTAKGDLALIWWADYQKTGDVEKLMAIAEYCCFDVKVTRLVYEYGVEHGYVKYADRVTGEILEVPVEWC